MYYRKVNIPINDPDIILDKDLFTKYVSLFFPDEEVYKIVRVNVPYVLQKNKDK